MIDKEVPWSFEKWILNFKDVNLPIGDLARYIIANPKFPSGDYLNDDIDYLKEHKAPSALIPTLCEVWVYYVASTGLTGDQLTVRNEMCAHMDA